MIDNKAPNNEQSIPRFDYKGEIKANTSKSYLQRAIVVAALAKGETTLRNCDESNDVVAVKSVIAELGALVNGKETLSITPIELGTTKNVKVNVGESGLALRMLASVSTLFNGNIELNGEGSLLNRPIQPIIEALTIAGVDVEHNKGNLPILIKSGIKNNIINLDGSFSSQIITGFLITLPLLNFDSKLNVTGLVSKPYIDMTLEVIKQFGVHIENNNYKQFVIKGNQSYKGSDYSVEGDWSGVANHLVGAAISGEITINNINPNSKQSDVAILQAIKQFGAIVEESENAIFIKQNENNAFEFDATDCPDIFPPLILLASMAKGQSKIIGTNRLIHKESNRLETILETFRKLNVVVESKENYLIVEGVNSFSGGTFDSFNDHRIAMVLAVAATKSNENIVIRNALAVNKSYPKFFDDVFKIVTFT
jgi:3-phosphoshikimate 1-carboxyvinyltransferase